MKRNLINEITSIKSRSEFNTRYDFKTKLNDIEYAFKENLHYNGKYNQELLKYIPIATVACFEGFFRSTYKELIDFGKPFSDNIVKFNQAKNVKFDFDIVNAIQTKTFSIGEFISHILPCNNYKDINSNLSTLIGKDFTSEIKLFEKESIFEKVKETSKNFKENSNQIFADINRTFELRHIFCHEFATNFDVNREEILRCFSSAKTFINQTNNFIWETIYPNAPETQTEMNIQSNIEFEKVDKEFLELIDLIKERKSNNFGIDPELFDKKLNLWKDYRKNKAELDASQVEGGTMYPTIYINSLKITTKEKIESLKKEFELELRKKASR
ncbi:HEPN domain-containing protein [uncultured Tenacibaculum sp.]|uniref:HEPN domain-containing protein n=1 Tax=uncultured Tenacibaculum sp. TaxID=174713 RepID=UPI002602A48D|nr:lysozyme inhibitor LprI family protein [uncultured Tenacibaculum sp.]